MSDLRRRCEEGYLYPAPPRRQDNILAVVVEKKGDETRTSMRQSEIYAYSHDIIIRDGYMVMPKIHWNNFEPGDWFMCKPIFSKDRQGNLKEEKELTDLHKFDPSVHKKYGIPPTKVETGNVRIIVPFVLCPEFIRNRETRNTYGSYKKLYLMNIGQGFIHNRNDKLLKKLRPMFVFYGIFEFHSRDNGAVNFAHRSEIKDHTGHVLERDSMWELVHLTDSPPVPVQEHEAMREDLRDLEKYAANYDMELERRGYYDSEISKIRKKDKLRENSFVAPLPLPLRCTQLPPKNIPVAEQPVDDGFEQKTIVKDRRPMPLPTRRSPDKDATLTAVVNETFYQNDVTLSASQVRVFDREATIDSRIHNDLELYRRNTIVRTSFINPETGCLEQRWIDRETQESAKARDILDFKFDNRYGIPQVLQQQTMQSSSHNNTFSDTTMDTTSNSIPIRTPLACSTPLGSPETRRRASNRQALGNFGWQTNEQPQRSNYYRSSYYDDSDTTATLAELRRDNNANPTGRRYAH